MVGEEGMVDQDTDRPKELPLYVDSVYCYKSTGGTCA